VGSATVIYTATTRALACLETDEHFNAGTPLLLSRYLPCVEVPFDSLRRVSQNSAKSSATDNKAPFAKVPSRHPGAVARPSAIGGWNRACSESNWPVGCWQWYPSQHVSATIYSRLQ
jgi:hypothetical protein